MARYELTKEAIEYVCNHTDRFRDKERTRVICEMRLGGVNVAEIGEEFGITAGRVREICEKVCRIYAYDARVGKVTSKVNLPLYVRIKAMSLDEMAAFFAKLYHDDIIATADRYICRKCKSEHGGHCPIGDDETCLFENTDEATIKLWLEGITSEIKDDER